MPKKPAKHVLENLHSKFGDNLQQSIADNFSLLEEADVKAKAIYYLGGLLSRDESISSTQKEIVKIFDEIFIDLTTTCYLSCCAIDNSSRTILRRVLELGFAITYLWDQPGKYWSWCNYEDHSNDLSFSEMLEYVNDRGFIDYINRENSLSVTVCIEKNPVNKVYHDLSNVIHGRTTSFESQDPDRFNYKKDDLTTILKYIIKTENILLNIWTIRFPKKIDELKTKLPSLIGYKYEY